MGNVAAKQVNQMAFCPPQPTYRKEDVNMWLDTDRGNRIPAFHIRRGNPLTFLVSHANAEDLGIVLSYWAYMAQELQARPAPQTVAPCARACSSPRGPTCATRPRSCRWTCWRTSTLATATRRASRARPICTRTRARHSGYSPKASG